MADSLTLHQFLSIGLDENTPDHVTISRTRRLVDGDIHQRIFTWVLERLAQAGLIRGKTIGVDSTTLEAMKSIVVRDTGKSYTAYLKRLAEAERIEAADAAVLRRMDRKRRKSMSNQDWENPNDPELEIYSQKAPASLAGRRLKIHALYGRYRVVEGPEIEGAEFSSFLRLKKQGTGTTARRTEKQYGGLRRSEHQR